MNAFNYHFPRIKISTCFTGKLLKLVWKSNIVKTRI
jgi:hypothetical protein